MIGIYWWISVAVGQSIWQLIIEKFGILFVPFVGALLSHLNFLAITGKLKYKQNRESFLLFRIISGTCRRSGVGFESPLNDDLFRKDWEKVSRVNTGRGDGSSNGIPFSQPEAHRDNAHSRNIKQTGFLLVPICWDNKWIFRWHVTIYRFTFRLLILDIQFSFLPSRRVFGRRDRHKCP